MPQLAALRAAVFPKRRARARKPPGADRRARAARGTGKTSVVQISSGGPQHGKTSVAPTWVALSKRCADLRDGRGDIAKHQLCIEPHHAIAQPSELPIAPRISAPAPRVILAVHLDHEPRGGRDESAMKRPGSGTCR